PMPRSAKGADMRRRGTSRFQVKGRQSMVAPVFARVLALSLLALLAACGGETFPEVFLEENAWDGGVPAGAQVVEPDEFRRLVGRGEVSLTSTLLVEEAAAGREDRFDEGKQQLEDDIELSPALQDLLDELAAVDDYAGD